MEISIPWYKSRTIWACIVTALIGAAQTVCLQFNFDLLGNPIASTVITILGAFGIYTRSTATTLIK
jgi:uncharacterized membrane protein